MFNLNISIIKWFVVVCIIIIIVCICVGISTTKSKPQPPKKIDNRTVEQKERDYQAAWDKWNRERGYNLQI